MIAVFFDFGLFNRGCVRFGLVVRCEQEFSALLYLVHALALQQPKELSRILRL